MLWMILQPGIKNFFHLLMLRQKIRNNTSVAVMDLHPRGQRLHPTKHHPALKRRKYRPSCLLQKCQPLRLLRPTAHHHSAQPIAVAIQKFCSRVHHHVRAQRQRLLKVGRHKRVVHYQLNLFATANPADLSQIAQRHQRIGRRLHIDHARIFADRAFHIFRIRCIHVGKIESEPGQHLIKQPRRPPIQIIPAHHMVARLQHARDRVDRGHSAGKNARRNSPFKRS